uniref:Uncharacterized protein n=1 Tax=Solanum tuberosum TaxID=4113 RepID=M1DXY5_SOLTU
MLNSEGSCGIMSRNYSTEGLKETSHLKTARLIGFMRSYGHEQLNSSASWVTCSTPMIRSTIAKEVMGVNDSTQGFKEHYGTDVHDSFHSDTYFLKTYLE